MSTFLTTPNTPPPLSETPPPASLELARAAGTTLAQDFDAAMAPFYRFVDERPADWKALVAQRMNELVADPPDYNDFEAIKAALSPDLAARLRAFNDALCSELVASEDMAFIVGLTMGLRLRGAP